MLRLLLLLPLIVGPISALSQSTSGGNTASNPSAWTIDSLKSHYDQLAAKDAEILALHKEISALSDRHAAELRSAADVRYDQRFQAQEEASKYTRTIQNEFRGSLSDLAGTKLSKSEFETAHKALGDQIVASEKSTGDKLESLNKSLTASIMVIQSRLDLKEGSSAGIGNFIGVTIGLVVAIVAVLAFILSTRKQRSGTASR